MLRRKQCGHDTVIHVSQEGQMAVWISGGEEICASQVDVNLP